jgi:hypothetical protein
VSVLTLKKGIAGISLCIAPIKKDGCALASKTLTSGPNSLSMYSKTVSMPSISPSSRAYNKQIIFSIHMPEQKVFEYVILYLHNKLVIFH